MRFTFMPFIAFMMEVFICSAGYEIGFEGIGRTSQRKKDSSDVVREDWLGLFVCFWMEILYRAVLISAPTPKTDQCFF